MTLYCCCWQPPNTLFGRVVSQMTMMFPFALVLVMLKNQFFQVLLCGRQCTDGHEYLPKVSLLSPNIWALWWCFRAGLHNLWQMRCVVSLCTVADGQSWRHYFVLANLRGTANIVSVVLVVSFTTIVVSKKYGTSSGRSMWVSGSFSTLSASH